MVLLSRCKMMKPSNDGLCRKSSKMTTWGRVVDSRKIGVGAVKPCGVVGEWIERRTRFRKSV
jgi:hypothetical protein